MDAIKKRDGNFLRLLLKTDAIQQLAMVKTIQDSQLRSVVQIVYNVLMGTRHLSKKTKLDLSKQRKIIRRFVSKDLTVDQRKRMFIKHFGLFLIVLKVIEKEL